MMQTKPILHSTTHRTPVGELTLVASDHGLHAILWPIRSPLVPREVPMVLV